MAFVKVGDALPVITYHDGEKEVVCDKCNKPKVVIAVKQDENELICECEEEKLN